ncbi:MAG: gamma-glutamyltransferase [Chloroflexota bacterium]
MASGPHGVEYGANRPVVMGRNGMVAAGHPLAAGAGVAALRQGGNAVDAAVAVAVALNVVEPQMSGIGGDGFIMIFSRAKGKPTIVNATGAAPLAATRAAYRDGIPLKGIRSVSVPGLADGWLAAHARYGRLALPTLFATAVDLAANGFPVSHKLAEYIAAEPGLVSFPSSRVVFAPEGRPLCAGEMLFQRDLARTLSRLAEEGAEVLYRGELARAIVACSERHGGLLTVEDLAAVHCRWQEPIETDYRGWTVFNAPPNSSGHALLEMLNLVEGFDLAALGCNSAAAIHVMVEAKKLAFADREAYLADPEWVEVPVAGLLDKGYAGERARRIDGERAALRVEPGDPWRFQEPGAAPSGRRPRHLTPEREDTTCFAVVDGEGNAVCQLQSIQSAFGSALVAEGTGILLNNRMTYWHLDEDHVDALEPGKRVRHTMNPVMVFRDGHLRLVFGTPGADTQVQSNLQVLTHILDFGMTVQEAVEAPRWRHLQNLTESTIPHACADELQLEGRFPEATAAALRRLGHPVNVVGDWAASGSEVAIAVNPETGALMGGADPRRDAYAIGY